MCSRRQQGLCRLVLSLCRGAIGQASLVPALCPGGAHTTVAALRVKIVRLRHQQGTIIMLCPRSLVRDKHRKTQVMRDAGALALANARGRGQKPLSLPPHSMPSYNYPEELLSAFAISYKPKTAASESRHAITTHRVRGQFRLMSIRDAPFQRLPPPHRTLSTGGLYDDVSKRLSGCAFLHVCMNLGYMYMHVGVHVDVCVCAFVSYMHCMCLWYVYYKYACPDSHLSVERYAFISSPRALPSTLSTIPFPSRPDFCPSVNSWDENSFPARTFNHREKSKHSGQDPVLVGSMFC